MQGKNYSELLAIIKHYKHGKETQKNLSLARRNMAFFFFHKMFKDIFKCQVILRSTAVSQKKKYLNDRI